LRTDEAARFFSAANAEFSMNSEASKATRPDANELALERTIMAAQRTLLAWTRTAISMIGFGFSLFKFLQYMRQGNLTPLLPLQGPRNLSLAFIGTGIFALGIAVVQNWQFLREICGPGGQRPFNLSLAVAGLVALIGIMAFVNVLFRLGPF
jgi:putative membrane protein